MAQIMTDIKYNRLAEAYNLIEEQWQEEFKQKSIKADVLMLVKRILFNFADTEFSANEYNGFLELLKDQATQIRGVDT